MSDRVELPVAVADELFTDLSMSVDCEMRTDYSGRGMYGEKCLGFVTGQPGRFSYYLGMLMAEWQPSSPGWDQVDPLALLGALGSAVVDDMGPVSYTHLRAHET